MSKYFIYQLPFASCAFISFVVSVFITVIYRKTAKTDKVNGVLFIKLFITFFYLLFAYSILFRPTSFANAAEQPIFTTNFILGKYILQSFADRNYIPVVGEVIIIIPFPVLLSIWLKKLNKFNIRLWLIIVVIFTTLIEPMQLVINVITKSPNFVIDIDDLILNFIGASVGIVITLATYKIIMHLKSADNVMHSDNIDAKSLIFDEVSGKCIEIDITDEVT